MARGSILYSSINSGEFSPRMAARVDFDRYPNAAALLRNFIPLPQGGIARRPGTKFAKEIKNSAAAAALFGFTFNQEQAYIIEAGANYFRFYRRQGRIEVDDTDAAITNGGFASNISGWTDPINGATGAYVSKAVSNASQATHTFSSQSIGAAADNRWVAVAISWYDNGGNQDSPDSVTIGGLTASREAQYYDSYAMGAIYAVQLPTGTTADIVVAMSGTVDNVRIYVYRVLCGRDTWNSGIDADSGINGSFEAIADATLNEQNGGFGIVVGNITRDTTPFTTAVFSDSYVQDASDQDGSYLFSACASKSLSATQDITPKITFSGGSGAEFGGGACWMTFGVANTITHDATNNRLTLTDQGTDFASQAEQAVTIGAGYISNEHVLKFKVEGYGNGPLIELRIGSASTENDILSVELGAGYHSIGFTPGATTVYIGFKNIAAPSRAVYIDDIAFLDNVPMEVITPYAVADLADLRVFQAADVMYLMHGSYMPRRLERRGHKSWSVAEAFFDDGPWGEINPGTDLLEYQVLANPFFEGTDGWTFAADTSGTFRATDVSLGAILDDNAANPEVYQTVTVIPGAVYVTHILFLGYEDSLSLYVYDADGTIYYEYLRPGWNTIELSSSRSELTFSLYAEAQDVANTLQACLLYPHSTRLLKPSATTGEITLTAYGFEPFTADDVGRLVRLEYPGREAGYGIITAYTSSTVVTMLVLREIPYAAPTETWRLGAWCETNGYPQTIGFFESRLIAANTTEQPQTLWLSQSNDLQNMRLDTFVEGASTVEDDDAIAVTLQSKQIDPIYWVASQSRLVIGTAGAQWTVESAGSVLTPSDIAARPTSKTPSAFIAAQEINQTMVFIDRSKRVVYELAYSLDADSYLATDLTILAQHVTKGGLQEITYQASPDSTLWGYRADGRLESLAYNRQHEILGWAQHILGGAFSTGDAVVEDIAIIPGAEDATQDYDSDERDEVWLLVKRTINGNTVRYIEFMEGAFEGPQREDYDTEKDWWSAVRTAQADAYYVDCGITYDGSSTSTITGLSHLEGETVKVLADGKVQADKTVSSGQITLDAAATKVQVGLGYTSKFMSLKVATGASAGTAVNKAKIISGVGLVLIDAGVLKATTVDHDERGGQTMNKLRDVVFRKLGMKDPSAAVPVFTGEWFVQTDGNKSQDPRMYLETDEPLPVTVIGLAPIVDGTDAP